MIEAIIGAAIILATYYIGGLVGSAWYRLYRAPVIDPRTNRPLGNHGTALQAITWALDHEDGNVDDFLRAWRIGDLEEWPDYYEWLNDQ